MLYITVRDRSKRKIVLIGSLILLLSVVYWGTPMVGNEHAPVTAPHNSVIDQVEVSSEEVALTFNVTWGTETFTSVLDFLDEAGVKGTMFIAGPWAEANEDLVKRAAEAGHDIGSLGYRQIDLTSVEAAVVQDELAKSAGVFRQILGAEPRLFRPPSGHSDENVVTAATESGMLVITASLDAMDWSNPGVEAIVGRVTDHVRPGLIIEFHADDSSAQLAEALPTIIEELHRMDYRCVSLSQLIGLDQGDE